MMTGLSGSTVSLDGLPLRAKRASLLPPGEGQDEGIENQVVTNIYPLSPTLSRREREFVGQQ
jgi:hypothetical protein